MKAKNLPNLRVIHPLFSAAILDIRRHLETDKNFSSLKYAWSKNKPKTKNTMQKSSKLTELWLKNQLLSHFENLWKELPIVFKIWTKIKNTLF
jgi:hypothetical protein